MKAGELYVLGDRKVMGWLYKVRQSPQRCSPPQTGGLRTDDVWSRRDYAAIVEMAERQYPENGLRTRP